jgi:hypothetical protein
VEVLYSDRWAEGSMRAQLEREALVLGCTPYDTAWLLTIGNPMVALEPRDYAPGVYDFRMLAGCRVTILDPLRAAADFDAPANRWGAFYDLAAEVAVYAAVVEVASGDDAPFWLDEWGRAHSRVDPDTRTRVWPRWWSDAQQRQHEQRQKIWIADARADIERRRAA